MRKLLLVLVVFILSILGLLLLFNTLTNTSKQTKIDPISNLPLFEGSATTLAKGVRIETTADSLAEEHYTQYWSFVKQQFAILFNNPNVEWQTFEEHSYVAKWIGRTEERAPLLLVASPNVATPDLATIPEWSYNPFVGKQTEEYVFGAGTQGGKSAMLAMLTVFEQMVQENILPDRTVYFLFPQDDKGEEAILKALQEAAQQPHFILKTGGGIAKAQQLWKINRPTAFVGISAPYEYTARLEIRNKKPQKIINQVKDNLQKSLPSLSLQSPTTQSFVEYLSPEMPFGSRLIFSNQWLLANMQVGQLEKNPLSQYFFGNHINLTLTAPSNPAIASIQLRTTTPFESYYQWLQTNIQHPQVRLLGEPTQPSISKQIAPIDHYAYRTISHTIKQVIPHTITVPAIAQNNSLAALYHQITPYVYYFEPIFYDVEQLKQKQKGIDAKITMTNWQQLNQFYYQLLQNVIK